MAKLTELQIERREFNRWFCHTWQDADRKFTHLPKWLKADLWLAWQAGRAALAKNVEG